jgi:hypothetical protein
MAVDIQVGDTKYMHVDITGPQDANRLFIFSGLIFNNFTALSGDWHRTTIKIELGEQSVLSRCNIYDVVATAWPSATNDNLTRYAIDKVNAYYSAVEGRLVLEVAIALAGNGGQLYKIGYQVMVKAHW